MSSLAEHLPPCLQWSSDPDDLARGVRFLPQRLFPQLQRCLESAEPPAPELLWEAWRMRPCALMSLTMMEVSVATMTSWLHAYELAWNQREEDGKKTVTATTTDAENSLQEPYVQACADLLLGETSDVSVPIGAVDGNQHGRVQFLHLDKIDGPAALHPHPQFVWQKFDETFLASLTAAWHLAEGNDTKPCQVFWHITEANGAPAKSTIQTGSSASAAALRAFWHLRRAQYVNGDVFDLILDDDIYVLGSCAANDGHIQDVGDLSAKLAAIQHHHTSFGQAPPATIVIAATAITRTAQNVTAIARASTWAEVEQVGTVEELIAVRSVTVQAAIGYLTCLAQRMDETPWFREGQPVCLSKVEVPAHVLKTQPSARFESDPTSGSGVSLGSDSRPSGDYPDEANFGISSRFGKPHYQARISWLEICAKTSEAVVIVGGAGFGKTSLLKATVRHIAWQSLEGLASRDGFLAFMPWPIYADLENWASCSGPPFETLQKTVLESLPVIESWPSLRLAALQWLMRDRLLRHQENIYFYLDSLDQVYERHTSILRERLQAIDSLHQRKIPSEIYRPDGFLEFPWWSCLYGPRLVISTRESGLSTHPKAMPFPITRLEVAALSADEAKELASKWLGAEQAARLDAHLRATPSLSIVADSPLLLTLACLVQAEPPKRDLPETTAALYQEMMRLLATGAWRSGGARSAALPNTDELLDSLRPVAWQLFSTDAGANRFDRNTMIGAIARATGRSPMEARKLLAQLVELGFLESSGRQNGDEYFHFRHATFREFLAASHLAALINSDGWTVAELEAWQPSHGWAKTKVTHLLDTNAFEPGWEPLFVFIAGLMRQPKPLLEMLADRSTDDIYRYRLGLLCRCYGSLSTDKENELEDLMDRVFPIIERMGRNARRRHPDRWKGWLATVEHLFNLPKSGSRII